MWAMDDEVEFATDLYRGTAAYYDRYRLPYPDAMLADLVTRAQVSGRGRLLDLACGTGQLALPLRPWFAEVWGVDQEPDMVDVLRAKVDAIDAGNVRPVVASAESFQAQPESFEIVVVGNAFHRLPRDQVADLILRWLTPGGHLALCWSSGPWAGGEAWQRALAAVLARWQTALDAGRRLPAGWQAARERRPDRGVLADLGFTVVGHYEFPAEHRWSLAELAGHIRSTSFLPAPVLGDRGAAFDADLADSLGPLSSDGAFIETMSFAYDLARKPG